MITEYGLDSADCVHGVGYYVSLKDPHDSRFITKDNVEDFKAPANPLVGYMTPFNFCPWCGYEYNWEVKDDNHGRPGRVRKNNDREIIGGNDEKRDLPCRGSNYYLRGITC